MADELLLAAGGGFTHLAESSGGWERRSAIEQSGAQCVAHDPRDPDRLFVGCRGGGLLKSADRGRSWSDTALPEPDVFSVAVSPVDGAVYAGTEPSRLFCSRDRGDSWRELEALQRIPSKPQWSFPPRPWTSHVRWIAPSPHDPDLLLVGIELGGLMRTDDGGETFSDHRPGAEPDVHSVAWHPRAEGRAYEAAGGGACWSSNGGLDWQPADPGRDRRYCWGLAPDPDDPDRWFVSAAPGPRQAHGSQPAEAVIYRWSDGGPWEALGGGLPSPLDSMPYGLDFGGAGLYAGLADGTLFRSRDRGTSWERLPVEAPGLSALVAIEV